MRACRDEGLSRSQTVRYGKVRKFLSIFAGLFPTSQLVTSTVKEICTTMLPVIYSLTQSCHLLCHPEKVSKVGCVRCVESSFQLAGGCSETKMDEF